jgi:hypothetical protein
VAVAPKIVQERLAHSNVQITLNRYSHVTMDMQRNAAGRREELLGGDVTKSARGAAERRAPEQPP